MLGPAVRRRLLARLRLPLPRLDAVLPHRRGATYLMRIKFKMLDDYFDYRK